MSVKGPKGKLLDTHTISTSGKKMIYDIEVPDEIKKKYKDDELTESARLLKEAEMRKLNNSVDITT